MNRRRPQAAQGVQVHSRGITLVPGNAVAGVLRIQQLHLAITADLGQDRGRSNRGHLTVALDHRSARHLQFRATVAVDQRQLGCHAQAFDRALHGQHGGVENIQAVNLFNLGAGNAPGQGFLADFIEEFVATGFAEFFRIVQTQNRPRRIENHRSRHHRTTEWAATDLIDTGDQFLHQGEIQPQLHQPRPASCNTAVAACTEASRRSAR